MCVQNQLAFLKVEILNGFKWSISRRVNVYAFIHTLLDSSSSVTGDGSSVGALCGRIVVLISVLVLMKKYSTIAIEFEYVYNFLY